jgi:large subunit ribosomal protein L12
MEYIYSAMILHSIGKPITEEGIIGILKAAGVEPDIARVKALTASLEGINIDETISTAVALPGFGMPPGAPTQAAAGVPEPTEQKEEEEKKKKKEEKEEKPSEEEAAAGLGALFG